jgi:hypothetical protein
LLVGIFTAACGGSPPAPSTTASGLTPVAASAEWPATTPEAEGLDPSRLRDLVSRIRRAEYGRIESLLLARNGRLAVEEYFGMILAAEWIRESTRRVVNGLRNWGGRRFDYAYLWWLLDDQGGDIVTAAGARGQFIFVAPRERLVMAVTSDNDDARWAAPVTFLYSHVLPSAR